MTEQALEILRQGLDRLGLTYPPDAVERLARESGCAGV